MSSKGIWSHRWQYNCYSSLFSSVLYCPLGILHEWLCTVQDYALSGHCNCPYELWLSMVTRDSKVLGCRHIFLRLLDIIYRLLPAFEIKRHFCLAHILRNHSIWVHIFYYCPKKLQVSGSFLIPSFLNHGVCMSSAYIYKTIIAWYSSFLKLHHSNRQILLEHMGHNTHEIVLWWTKFNPFLALNIYISLHLGKFDWNLNKEY